MAERTKCWRPKENAPGLTDHCLYSDEDFAVLRRLQRKYNLSFPWEISDKETTKSTVFSGLPCIASPIVAGRLKIKSEPSTPLSNVSHGICENKMIKVGPKTETFQNELLGPAFQLKTRDSLMDVEDPNCFQNTQCHVVSSCSSGTKRKSQGMPDYNDDALEIKGEPIYSFHSPSAPVFFSASLRPRKETNAVPKAASYVLDGEKNWSKCSNHKNKDISEQYVPGCSYRSFKHQEDTFATMPNILDKPHFVQNKMHLTEDMENYKGFDTRVLTDGALQLIVTTPMDRRSNRSDIDLWQKQISLRNDQTVSCTPAAKCCANSVESLSDKHKKQKSTIKGKESSREKIQKKLTAYVGIFKKTEVSSLKDELLHSSTHGKKKHVHKKGIIDSGTLQSERQTFTDNSVLNVKDTNAMSSEEKQQLATQCVKCRLISCMVYHEDGTTNTDSTVCDRPKVRGLLLHLEDNTYLFPVPGYCDPETTQWGKCLLNEILRSTDIVKVAVNCKHFVISLLRDFSLGGFVEWQFEDPMVAGWLVRPDNPPCTLHALCKTVLVSDTQDLGPHSDMVISIKVMEKLRSSLKKKNLWPLFYHVEMPLTPLLANMELQAIRVNVQTFITFSDVLKILYEELKLDKQLPSSKKVTLTACAHHKSTSEPMLRQLVPVHPLPSVILEYRHLLKLKSTYIDGMLESMKGGALTTHWDQTAAATGRLASAHPNIQAIPKMPTTITDFEDNCIVGSETKKFDIYAREPFICKEGNVFLAADFDQIELRLLAHLANDPSLKDMFSSNRKPADIFVQLTSQWLSKPCQDVVHAEREQTKRVVYSIMYGVGKERLAEYLKVSSTRAKDIMDSFLVSFPAIQMFTRKCIDYAKQHGYTETVMGRKRWFEKIHYKAGHIRAQAERQAVNFCVQGSAADLCKAAMLRVEQALHKNTHLSARLLIHIHDELVWELPHQQLQEMTALTRRVMEDDALLCQPILPSLTVPITISLSSGTSWAHLKSCS